MRKPWCILHYYFSRYITCGSAKPNALPLVSALVFGSNNYNINSSNGITTRLNSGITGFCSPSYQLSSLVALWADSSPISRVKGGSNTITTVTSPKNPILKTNAALPGCIVILPPGDEGSTAFCTPEYQLSSRVAMSQLKEPRVMKVDTRDCKTQWFPS